jgi:hypothetical protein
MGWKTLNALSARHPAPMICIWTENVGAEITQHARSVLFLARLVWGTNPINAQSALQALICSRMKTPMLDHACLTAVTVSLRTRACALNAMAVAKTAVA